MSKKQVYRKFDDLTVYIDKAYSPGDERIAVFDFGDWQFIAFNGSDRWPITFKNKGLFDLYIDKAREEYRKQKEAM